MNKDVIANIDYPENTLKKNCERFIGLAGKIGDNDIKEALKQQIYRELHRQIVKDRYPDKQLAKIYYRHIIKGFPELNEDWSRTIPDIVLEGMAMEIIEYYNKLIREGLY